ncbi:MAG TPA: hypothetical protein VN775_11670 [Opitutaceae bacterium]|nr:hypothetical protein [Opitutaceae bacterium]
MTYMLCRNRVSDFRRWKRVFDSHAGAHEAAGLLLTGLWRDAVRPNEVFFLFEVRDKRRAKAFIAAPGAAEAGAASGVIDGEYHFIRDAGLAGYRRGG